MTVERPVDFGNPNKDALHPAFSRKDGVRISNNKMKSINPDAIDGPVKIYTKEEIEEYVNSKK